MSLLLDAAFWGVVGAGAVRLATPLLIAALGELFVARSGMVNLGIDGMMLAGAFAGAFAAAPLGWAAGLAAGALAGAALGAVMAGAVVGFGADLTVTGVALALLGAGLGDYLFQLSAGGLGAEGGASLAPLLGGQSLLTYAGLAGLAVIGQSLRHLRAGLALAAIGDDPAAAAGRGVAVGRWRAVALGLGGTFAGLAGAAVSVGYVGSYSSGMTAGRGYIAIAIVILGRASPPGLLAAALLFGGIESFALQIQGRLGGVSPELCAALPFLLTLAILPLSRRRR